MNEYPTTGIWPGYNKRQDMMREAIGLMRLLWRGDEVTFNGEYYVTRKAKLYTMPRGHIPIYISSLVPNSAFFAGYYGDGLITVANPHEVMKGIISNFEAGAWKAGKDPEMMPKQVEIWVAYTDDTDAAVKMFKQYWAGTMIFATHLQNIYTPEMVAINGMVVGEDVIKNRQCISSDPEVHAKFVQRFIDMEFDRLYFHSAGPDQYEFIESYGRDVLPIIRERNQPRTVANK